MKLPFGLPSPPRAPLHPPSAGALYLLFATTAFAVAPHLLRQPAWIGAIVVAIIAWRVVIALRGALPPGALVRAVLSVGMAALVILQYQTIFGRTAGSALLVSFTALKVLETSSLRDAMFCNILVTIVVLATFLFDQSPASAAYGLGCLLLVIVNFTSLVARGRLPARRAAGLTVRVFLLGLPVALVAYVLFPRLEGSLWGIAPDSTEAVSGLSDRIEPGSVSRLNLDDAVAFRVDFDGDTPERAELYWRALVLERYDGRVWAPADDGAHDVAFDSDTEAEPFRYEVTLEATDTRWLPVLDLPVSVERPNRIDDRALARSKDPVRERTRYRAASTPARYLRTGRRQAATPDLPLLISDEVRELAREFGAPGGGAEAVAARILAYFREQPFHYTLTPPVTGPRPVHEFLFDTRRGYCEHYASAFAVLMRAAGFDARVVLGYQGGERNPTGGYTIVRQYDAHAWVEIRVAGRGWTRVDPTAAVAPERVEMGLDALRRLASTGALEDGLDPARLRELLQLGWLDAQARRLRLLGDAFTHQWNTWVMAYGPEQQRLLLQRLGVKAPDRAWMLLALTAAASAFMLLTWAMLSGAGREAETPGKYYRRFVRQLVRAGLPPVSGEGPRDLGNRAATRFPGHAERIARITGQYAALVYAPPGRARLSDLKRAVRAFNVSRGDGIGGRDPGGRQ